MFYRIEQRASLLFQENPSLGQRKWNGVDIEITDEEYLLIKLKYILTYDATNPNICWISFFHIRCEDRPQQIYNLDLEVLNFLLENNQ